MGKWVTVLAEIPECGLKYYGIGSTYVYTVYVCMYVCTYVYCPLPSVCVCVCVRTDTGKGFVCIPLRTNVMVAFK